MKVLELKTNNVIDVNDGYGERLIQHGQAVLFHETQQDEQPKKAKKEQPSRKSDA